MTEQPVARFVTAIMAGDDDEAERLASAWGERAEKDEEAQLIQLTRSENADVRWWSVRALAGGRTPDAVAATATALADPNPEVRSVALLALGHLHGRQPGQVVQHLGTMAALLTDDEGFVRQTAVEALALCGNDAIATLAQVLDGREDVARTRAAAALRKIGSMESAPVLFKHLNDANYLVHSYCQQALDEMGLLETTLVLL